MVDRPDYLMENEEESLRLEVKTNPEAFESHARWCGIEPGMRVLDAGCGPGLTSALLQRMVQPGGQVLGLDYSPGRITHARSKYGNVPGIHFEQHDIRLPTEAYGRFDCIIVRFVMEYNRMEGLQIVENLTRMLEPAGMLCLIDLDYNCLNHYPLPARMEEVLRELMRLLEERFNFDPYAGRKLYSYLYGKGYRDVAVDMRAHHLIYGEVKDNDAFNWLKKVEMATRKAQGLFSRYPGGHERFFEDFQSFFQNPGRFTYTPVILCKGLNPAAPGRSHC